MNLSKHELALISEALNTHAYWELAEDHYRESGEVMKPGSDDPTDALLIRRALRLSEHFHNLSVAAPDTKPEELPEEVWP